MMMKVSFLGIDVEIPDDPVGFIKGKAIELLNYLGYEWPITDDGTLRAWGDQWDAAESRINSFVRELEGGVAHVAANNQGAFADAFKSYMNGDESNLQALKSIADAAPIAAASYRGAALIVTGLRTLVIGKLILDAVQLAAALLSGGSSAAVSFLINKGISAAINIAIDQAINQLLGAA